MTPTQIGDLPTSAKEVRAVGAEEAPSGERPVGAGKDLGLRPPLNAARRTIWWSPSLQILNLHRVCRVQAGLKWAANA